MGTIRKIFTTGVGAALMTENGIRNAFSDINLTGSATKYIARQALKTKEEFSKVFFGELKRFLGRIDIHEEIQKALSGLTFEIDARIKITSPAGHGSVKVRKVRRKVRLNRHL